MIRVFLVDDQTLVRQGIRSLLALADGIEVVAEAIDGRQAIELIPQVKPDVVLMDMRMPMMSGLEALQALGRAGSLPPTIILTTFDDDALVLAGIKAGAKGYMLKDVSLEQLVDAIQTVASGGSLVQPAVTQRLLSGLWRWPSNQSPARPAGVAASSTLPSPTPRASGATAMKSIWPDPSSFKWPDAYPIGAPPRSTTKVNRSGSWTKWWAVA